jgi:hypothetical protein
MGLASLFAVCPGTIRSKIALLPALEPPRGLAEPLDQGLDPVHLGQPTFDVVEPTIVGVVRLGAQSKLSVFKFSK